MTAVDLPSDPNEFRAYARNWLAENAPPPPPERLPITPIEVMTVGQRDYLQSWQRKCYEAGLVGCDIPKAYGGQYADHIHDLTRDQAAVHFMDVTVAADAVSSPDASAAIRSVCTSLLALVTAGMSGAFVNDIPTCQEVVDRIVWDAEEIINERLRKIVSS